GAICVMDQQARSWPGGAIISLETLARGVSAEIAAQIYVRNADERARTERALREREHLLTLAERSAGIGIWDTDLATAMSSGTEQFFRIMGLEPVAYPVPIETLRALRHPEDRERVVQGFRKALTDGSDSYEMEYRIRRPDGETRWIFGRGRVIRDAAGRPV